ncbi:MAG: DUF2760 domain-containing protein [Desulfobacula sp.]|nr:DUF2760 domain-containing protein [Desulfobacula sp.]
MEWLKIYSKKFFWIIAIFALLISACINVGLYFAFDWLSLNLFKDTGNEVITNNLELISNNFYFWVVPAVSGVFLLCGWVLWLILRSSMSKTFTEVYIKKGEMPSKGKSKKDFVDQKIEQDRKRRLFLHSLSVLQRDGRLLDFFDEDLSLYEDEQIGAAVRSVQEDCKRTIKKYIDLKPVIESEEGEMVTIEPGFDIDSIKLIGNVSGEPPFEGILKHRGWKAGKKEIPKLSDIRDVAIITPAEVEIQ